jgi:hypothetical protein
MKDLRDWIVPIIGLLVFILAASLLILEDQLGVARIITGVPPYVTFAIFVIVLVLTLRIKSGEARNNWLILISGGTLVISCRLLFSLRREEGYILFFLVISSLVFVVAVVFETLRRRGN